MNGVCLTYSFSNTEVRGSTPVVSTSNRVLANCRASSSRRRASSLSKCTRLVRSKCSTKSSVNFVSSPLSSWKEGLLLLTEVVGLVSTASDCDEPACREEKFNCEHETLWTTRHEIGKFSESFRVNNLLKLVKLYIILLLSIHAHG